MRILLATITCEKGDVDGNLARHLDLLAAARDAGCGLAVFPELGLTGSVDPVRHPERAVALGHKAVGRLVEATAATGVAAVFGLGERRRDSYAITQVSAAGGAVAAVQRKRHLGDDEEGFSTSTATAVFEVEGVTVGTVICAEAGVDFTWDATAAAGARLVCFCSAPGLYGRRTDEASWRAGFEWWEGCGLGDARRHARRLGVWVAMATQAGPTVDEDFPGIAALVSPEGEVVARLPDWRPGTLLVEVPLTPRVERAGT